MPLSACGPRGGVILRMGAALGGWAAARRSGIRGSRRRRLFAVLEIDEAAHGQHGHAVGVEELELERCFGGGFEGDGAVFVDGDGAEDFFDEFVVGQSCGRDGAGRLADDFVDAE